MTDTGEAVAHQTHQFGTFGGVFTPSILTIFGLIMFMRANQVVGNAGVPKAVLILSLSSLLTLLTGLSISAISSNTPVKGGGAYFLISRVLGPAFGTAIGLALFFAQALSVPFYILGFVEALTQSVPILQPWQHVLELGVLIVLFALAWSGASWVIRIQYVILAVLTGAIITFMVGLWQHFDLTIFRDNLVSHYQVGKDFWRMFAIYFPAVTGIMAGVNMSGDLRNPARSIPLGTLAAVLVGFFVYGGQLLLAGGLAPASELIAEPYLSLVSHAALGLGWLVAAGVFCATISSAIGSNLGAPRVLQAVARDGVLHGLDPFAAGTRKGDEPRRALALTFVVGAVTLFLAGRGDNQDGLNMVAAVVTMVFLYTYGMTNLAAFVESLGSNPSFRPRFRCFHWTTGLAGGVGCVAVAFMINAVAAAAALAVILGLFYVVRSREMTAAYGDARRGFIYSRVSNNLQQLAAMAPHPKNWRPTIVVFSGSPYHRPSLIEYARWIGQRSGIVSLVYILEGQLAELEEKKRAEETRLARFATANELSLFPEVVVMDDFDRQLSVFLQAHSIGPLKPNIVFFGWPQNESRLRPYYQHLRTVQQLGKSILVLVDHGTIVGRGRPRIDLWWRGRRNGSLMVILAHLLMLNPEWSRARLRLLRQVAREEQVTPAREELEDILSAARIIAEIHIPVSQASFASILAEQSADASLIMLGLRPPAQEYELAFHRATETMLQELPSTMLVCSSGEADLHA